MVKSSGMGLMCSKPAALSVLEAFVANLHNRFLEGAYKSFEQI